MTTRALPGVARYALRTMPGAALLTGCLAGVALLAVIAAAADSSHQSLGQDSVRLAFLPVLAGLAFIARGAFRPLTLATPVPAWVGVTAQVLLAVPVLALTCWVQLRITAHTVPAWAGRMPAVYPLLAQLTGWSAITIAIATCVDRSRFAGLSGAAAAPLSLAVIGIAWYTPALNHLLVTPPANAHEVTLGWYAIAGGAAVLTSAALRDRWHRYARVLRRAV
jgi:hypothetical protein